jgi:hypothetical protein
MSAPAATETATAPANVIITAERLAELERFEEIVLKRKEKDMAKLSVLKAADTPEKSKMRVLKHYDAHKEEINAKRREKRRLEREAKEAAAAEAAKTPGV